MRRSLVVLAACSSTAPSPRASMPPAAAISGARGVRSNAPGAPVDVLASLAAPRDATTSITVGPAQLVLGGPSLQPLWTTTLDVGLLERRGQEIRVGIHTPQLAFAVWTARSQMLSVVAREQIVSAFAGGDATPRDLTVVLKAGARVEKLTHHERSTKIRYVDRLQVEGWVPDDVLADEGPEPAPFAAFIGHAMLVMPGSSLRDATRFDGRTLATFRYSVVADQLDVLADGWLDVRYEDGGVRVRGYMGKFLAPSPYRATRDAEPTPPFTGTTTLPAHTCLYAGDEPIGFAVDATPATLEPSSRVGWFDAIVDTPWGAVTFGAKGPTETTLATCGS